MPSETMDLKLFSSPSFFSNDPGFPSERQVGFWKSDTLARHYGSEKPVASSPLEKFMPSEGQIMNSFDHSESHLTQDQKVKAGLDRNAVGAERAAGRSSTMLRSLDYDKLHPMPYFAENSKIGMMGTQYENNLFSSSLTDLFNQKLKLSLNNAPYGHSVDTVGYHYQEEEPLESTKEIEAQTIGNLLPDDDDLLSGVTEGLDYIAQPNSGDDMEELDFFNSVGGMDLGDDSSFVVHRSSEFTGGITNGHLGSPLVGEHPNGEHPSRTLFVRNINSNVEDSELKTLFEQYGDIHTLYTACKHRGFVMISYYDIRAARNAMKSLQNRSLRHRKLDIHYSIPKDNPSEKDINQGTLVAINLDTSISNDELLQIVGVYGEIKEIREIPHRSHHKFIEFYDMRAAEAALRGLDKNDIVRKRIKLEPSWPGGARSLVQPFSSDQDADVSYLKQNSPPTNTKSGFSGLVGHGTHTSTSMDNGTMFGVHSAIRSPINPYLETAYNQGISSSVPNSVPSLVRVRSVGNQSSLAESGHSRGTLKFDIRSTPTFHSHSLPEYQDGLTNYSSTGPITANIGPRPEERMDNRHLFRVQSNGYSMELSERVFGSSGNGSCLVPGHHYAWGNSYHPQPPGLMWPNPPLAPFANGMSTHLPSRLHGLPRAPSHTLNAFIPTNNHHVGSAPAINPSVWDRRHSHAGEPQEASAFHSGSLGNFRMSTNSLQSMEPASQNIYPCSGGNGVNMSIPPKIVGLQTHHQRGMGFPGRAQMIPMMNSFEASNERARSRRNEGSYNQADSKKQYELEIERIKRGEDNRTTLMIKNIPNKYTSKMLLAAIDENHRGTYDFLYLPIDFKNKCNVGYAFINLTDPRHIVPFYQAFNGKKWEKFNSEKVASLAYARIQGKSALITHFQNSSLMNEDKRCRPILLNTDGPNAGDQVPFPMGGNVRTRPGKTQSTNHEGSSINLESREDLSNGDSFLD